MRRSTPDPRSALSPPNDFPLTNGDAAQNFLLDDGATWCTRSLHFDPSDDEAAGPVSGKTKSLVDRRTFNHRPPALVTSSDQRPMSNGYLDDSFSDSRWAVRRSDVGYGRGEVKGDDARGAATPYRTPGSPAGYSRGTGGALSGGGAESLRKNPASVGGISSPATGGITSPLGGIYVAGSGLLSLQGIGVPGATSAGGANPGGTRLAMKLDRLKSADASKDSPASKRTPPTLPNGDIKTEPTTTGKDSNSDTRVGTRQGKDSGQTNRRRSMDTGISNDASGARRKDSQVAAVAATNGNLAANASEDSERRRVPTLEELSSLHFPFTLHAAAKFIAHPAGGTPGGAPSGLHHRPYLSSLSRSGRIGRVSRRQSRPGSTHSSSSSASTSSFDRVYLLDEQNAVSPTVLLSSPYQSELAQLRLESLRIEEENLLELKRQEELERIRGPQPKWYMLKSSQFHEELRKNNELRKNRPSWQALLDYRTELEQASRKYRESTESNPSSKS